MFTSTSLMLVGVAPLALTPTPTTSTSTVIVNKPELAQSNDITGFLLDFTLVLLIGGIALFVWMMKTRRLRLATRYSVAQREVPPRIFSRNETNQTRVSRREMELYPPAPPLRDPALVTVQEPLQSDDPLKNKKWLSLVKECVAIYDELDTLVPGLDPARQEMAEHVQSRLEEILVRSGVEVIAHDQTFDIRRHKLAVPGPSVAPMTPITETVSLGFAVKQLVLRQARVRVTSTMKE